MWTRAELKQRAKNVLRGSYWKAFLVSIVLSFAVGGGNVSFNYRLGNMNFGRNNRTSYGYSRGNEIFNSFPDTGVFWAIIIGIIIVAILIILVVAALRIFLGYPLEIGGRRYFVQSAEGNVDLNNMGFAFNGKKYMDIVKAMLWRAVLNFLWYLLFIIPGIVKSFAYSMVPYILTDNPNIGYRRALELSNNMTRGHKFRIFVLGLSFIGWYILGTLALFVGVLFVIPYQNATMAELYLALRNNALENGMCTYEELNLVQQISEGNTEGELM